jgi:hypothetical protein
MAHQGTSCGSRVGHVEGELRVKLDAATKERIAITVCAASVLAAVAAMHAKWNLPNTIMCVSLVWACAGHWVSRLPPLWHKNFREIFAIARRGGLRDSRVASAISWGSTLLMVMYFVAVYESS